MQPEKHASSQELSHESLLEARQRDINAELREQEEQIRALLDRLNIVGGAPQSNPFATIKDFTGDGLVAREDLPEHMLSRESRNFLRFSTNQSLSKVEAGDE